MSSHWLEPAELDRFERSMERCFADSTFLSRFYARFLLSSDEVAAKFENVDLKRQGRMLKQSLYLVMRAARGLDDGLVHLERIATSHGERGLDIGEDLYRTWLDALVAVASETDPRFDDSLAVTWRAALQPCIDQMTGR